MKIIIFLHKNNIRAGKILELSAFVNQMTGQKSIIEKRAIQNRPFLVRLEFQIVRAGRGIERDNIQLSAAPKKIRKHELGSHLLDDHIRLLHDFPQKELRATDILKKHGATWIVDGPKRHSPINMLLNHFQGNFRRLFSHICSSLYILLDRMAIVNQIPYPIGCVAYLCVT